MLRKTAYNGRRTSILCMVPMENLEEVRSLLKKLDGKFRVEYRGPRTIPEDVKARDQLRRQNSCLKKYATHFSVYRTY